jgi:hypothetical protein
MTSVTVTEANVQLEVFHDLIALDIIPEVTIIEISSAVAPAYIKNIDTPDDDLTADGLKVTLTAAENLVFGEVCYIATNGKATKADASANTTSRAMTMATGTIAIDTPGTFLLLGFTRNSGWTWIVGAEIYLSETTGALTQTAPTASDSVTQVMGTAISADLMYFNPSMDILVHV